MLRVGQSRKNRIGRELAGRLLSLEDGRLAPNEGRRRSGRSASQDGRAVPFGTDAWSRVVVKAAFYRLLGLASAFEPPTCYAMASNRNESTSGFHVVKETEAVQQGAI